MICSHIRYDSDKNQQKTYQALEQHLKMVSQYAAAILADCNLANSAKLIGLYHDAGKASPEFQTYIEKATSLDDNIRNSVRRGSVNHSFAGVQLLFANHYQPQGSLGQRLSCEIMAYAVGSHHGLFDCAFPHDKAKNGFQHRLDYQNPHMQEIENYFYNHVADREQLTDLFQKAALEIENIITKIQSIKQTSEDIYFYCGLTARLLTSALIDADRCQTWAFMSRQNEQFLTQTSQNAKNIWLDMLNSVEDQISKLSRVGEINQIRHDISAQCQIFAENPGGIYRLSVPTGSGKTLAGLRYSLHHALKHDKQRIFFIIPLLSILDQNAREIKKYVGHPEYVLEHHSNIIRYQENDDTLDQNELFSENWQAPITITTLFQFLNTLFAGKTASIRRFQALVNSVIVIDEVQTVPLKMLSQFNMALNFLTHICQATIILASATQPPLDKAYKPLLIAQPPDIVNLNPNIEAAFKRTEIISQHRPYGYDAATLVELALKAQADYGSCLLICNKKVQAAEIYRLLADCGLETHHLSTSLCKKHREAVIAAIKSALIEQKPLICVATQLVEAGVDFSFGSVIRLCAGMDSIIQAAGRCNRHGEQGKVCPVYIVNSRQENLAKLKEIKRSKDATEELLVAYETEPQKFANSLQSHAALDYFYQRLYHNIKSDDLAYYLSKYDTTMLDLLSYNNQFRSDKTKFILNQSFATAGKEFKVFDENNYDILVPYQEGQDYIIELGSEKAKYDLEYRRKCLEEAKMYTISIYQYQLQKLQEMQAVYEILDGAVLVLQANFYDHNLGLLTESEKFDFWEV